MLELLATDLWTLFCNIMFIHTMWESCRAAVLDSTHSMSKLEIQDEVQF